MTMPHKLSVIVTIYNIAKHLPRFFDSMDRQTFRDYSLLLFDDGSTDESLQLCREYAQRDDRVKVIAFEHYGISKTRNLTMDYIETPLTAYADGDDYFEPDYLKHLVDAMEKNGADLVISRVEYHLDNAEQTHIDEHVSRGDMLIKREQFDEMLPMLLEDRSLNYLYAKMFRSDLLKPLRIGDDVMQGSDTMLVIQYVAKADSIMLIDDMDYHYVRYNSNSVTAFRGRGKFERFLRIHLFLLDFTKESGLLTDNLLFAVDGRFLRTCAGFLNYVWKSDIADDEKILIFDDILTNDEYIKAYEREKDRFAEYNFDPAPPMSGTKYLLTLNRDAAKKQRKSGILDKCPKFIVDIYHRIKYGE